ALHTFTLDSGASRSFFCDSTTLMPLSRPIAVSLADPSGGPVLAHSSTVLSCPATPSGLLSELHLPSFSTNMTTASHQVAMSGQVLAAASRSSPCSCRPLSHETLLWHHRLGHPSLRRLRGMASRTLVSGLPRSLPPLPSGPAPPCVPCVKGRQRAAPHSSEFPPIVAPLRTLHMDVWGPTRVRGQGHERYFLLVVDDYSRYTTVFPLRRKGEVTEVLIDWICGTRRQLSESFSSDLPVLRLHSDRGGEFSSDLLRAFCRVEGIRQTFTLPASPQQNGIAECRIGMVMDVARTSMIHAAAPHFLWPFAVQYAAHQIDLQPRVSLPETTYTLRWMGKVGDLSVSRAVPCVPLSLLCHIVSGMWIFRVKRPPGSPPVFMARYVARGFSQRQGVDFFQTFSPTPKMTTLQVLLHVATQRDYELHSLDFSTAFLQGSLLEEIWLRRSPGFTGSFPAGTQWSLRRPVYGLRQALREWHDTLRMTLAALGFAASTADPSLFLRTDATLPLFYVLVFVDDLVFAIVDTEALAHVKSELQKRHTCTDLGELTSYLGLRITRDRAQCTIILTQSHMVQQVLQRFGFTYSSPQSTPLPTGHSLSAPPLDESVEPSVPYPELVGCLMVLRYLCSTSGMGLVLHAPHWSRRRFLGVRLAHLPAVRLGRGASFSSSSGCRQQQKHRMEHRTKHIALRYFLARELQQCGQLRLAYVASRANTADVFTKALQPCDHQRFCTVLGLDFCRDKGIRQTFTLPASPQQNGIAVDRTSMIHAAAPHFLWPFAV
ncbi:unnamed protein product, partial [Closterium sp. NIES-54]